MRGILRASLMTLALACVVALWADPVPAGASVPKPAPPRPAGTLAPGARLDANALALHADRLLGRTLKAEKADPSPRCDDAEFLRRVCLDLTGCIPTADRAVAFLDSKDADKRSRLVDELLAGKEFGRHQADLWQSLLLPHDSEANQVRTFFPNLRSWLEDGFNENRPWNATVRELLTATGPVDKPGPAVYYVAHTSVDKLTDNFTKQILGVQLQCAQCHNHPFTDWKQDEYWGMAAFFLKVRPDGNAKAAAKADKTVNIVEGRQAPVNRKRLPESAKILPPKFLQGARPSLSPGDLYRPALAEWATSPANPFLARAFVNRLWAQLFGRGFVAPVDDMHDGNAPSHPELLADLSNQFVAHDFDVKYLFRAACNSAAYGRSSQPAGNNRDAGPEVFARMAVKVLSPEQLYDSLTAVLGKPEAGGGGKGNGMTAKRGPVSPRDQFVAFYGLDDGTDPTEFQAGIPQVLRLMNGAAFNNPRAVAALLKTTREPKAVVERLYLTALSRRPTAAETARAESYLARAKGEPAKGYADLLWALVNCSEFSLNR